MKIGQNILIDPKLTGIKDWINAIVIEIRNNPFPGLEIAAKDEKGVIYFDSSKYFKELN